MKAVLEKKKHNYTKTLAVTRGRKACSEIVMVGCLIKAWREFYNAQGQCTAARKIKMAKKTGVAA